MICGSLFFKNEYMSIMQGLRKKPLYLKFRLLTQKAQNFLQIRQISGSWSQIRQEFALQFLEKEKLSGK